LFSGNSNDSTIKIQSCTDLTFAYGGHWPSSNEYWTRSNYQKNAHNYHQIDDEIKFNHYKHSCDCVKLKECDLNSIRGFTSDYFNHQLSRIFCGYIDDEIAVCCNTNALRKPAKEYRPKKKSQKKAHHNVELSLPGSMQEYCPSPISGEFDLDKNHKFHKDVAISTTVETPKVSEST
jgi:hypothetical protein